MNKGKIVQISGPVEDVSFESGKLPALREALTVTLDGRTEYMEVAYHVGHNTVRCIMFADTEGLMRGTEVVAAGSGITVPVGKQTLGRMFNVLGEPIDGLGELSLIHI